MPGPVFLGDAEGPAALRGENALDASSCCVFSRNVCFVSLKSLAVDIEGAELQQRQTWNILANLALKL